MVKSVIDYLLITEKKYADKTAFVDSNKSISFSELKKDSFQIAYEIIKNNINKQPVAVFLDKSVECIVSFLGALASNNFYSPLDVNMPNSRIEKIMSTLNPAVVITDANHVEQAKSFANEAIIIVYEEALKNEIDEEVVYLACNRILDTDIMYVLFTSGSTGNPKGVMISNKSLVDFIEWGTECLDIDDSYIFGNQTPFYFSMSVLDIYQTIKNGATMHIIPQSMFTLPVELMKYLFDNKINTLFWVPSALTLIAAFRLLNEPHLDDLRNVFFGGEVMPLKQLNKWIENYPSARFINFYGPTEVTDTCTIYEVNRQFEDVEKLPMGFPCNNMDVFLLDEEDKLVTDSSLGEVCVRGTGLAYGYYNNPEKTEEVFVQNPLNTKYKEIIYRTGDLAQYNEYGELVYMGRKDFQIKHMGHRIELGEIETAISSINGVDSNCVLYDSDAKKIVLFYTGAIEEKLLMQQLNDLIPHYMLPNKKNHLDKMPMNLNGKIDRQKLKEMI